MMADSERHDWQEKTSLNGKPRGEAVMMGTGYGLPCPTWLSPQACSLSRVCGPCSRNWLGSVTTVVKRLVPRASGELSTLRAAQDP